MFTVIAMLRMDEQPNTSLVILQLLWHYYYYYYYYYYQHNEEFLPVLTTLSPRFFTLQNIYTGWPTRAVMLDAVVSNSGVTLSSSGWLQSRLGWPHECPANKITTAVRRQLEDFVISSLRENLWKVNVVREKKRTSEVPVAEEHIVTTKLLIC
jgi:hypothetical protein